MPKPISDFYQFPVYQSREQYNAQPGDNADAPPWDGTRYLQSWVDPNPANVLEFGNVRLAVGHQGLQPGRSVIVGIRPEDCLVDGEQTNSFPIVVDFCEELGSSRLLHGQVSDHDFIVQVPGGPEGLRMGRHTICIPSGAIHLFDAGTGNRIEADRVVLSAAA